MKNIVKENIKNLADVHPSYTSESIINSIREYSTVSFDIFDTLVNRDVAVPSDVFLLTAQKCMFSSFESNRFRDERIKAEKKARETEKDCEEIALDDIYKFLEKYSVYDNLKHFEIETELEVSYPNPVMREVYNWCLENQKDVLLISDMYLDRESITEILKKCGYEGYSGLYVSSEVKKLKSTGHMFSYVRDQLEIDTQRWIHVGDSVKGDYFGARNNKIHAIRIATSPSRTKLIKNIAKESLYWGRINKILSGHLTGKESLYYCYGTEALSPFIYGFCVWLHNKAKELNIAKLFFLARDGYLLQLAYNEIYGIDAISNEYLYVSRRALRIPVLYTCKCIEEFFSLIPKNKYLSRQELYDLFGLDDEFLQLWEMSGFKADELIFTNSLPSNSKFKVFYSKIENICRKNAKNAFMTFVEYLNEKTFNGDIAIVDIGWAGTIQKCLNKIIENSKIEANIYGLYVGLTEGAESELNAQGYIPSQLKPQVATAGLFEYPFLAPEGSLRKIDYKGNKIYIDTGLYEYEDNEDNRRFISEMQRGVIDGIRYLKWNQKIYSNTDVNLTYMALRRTTKEPSLNESRIFGNMLFYDGSPYYLAKPRGIISYLMKPKTLLKDFSNSGWKVGFLKRLLILPFHYSDLLERLKK